MPVNTEGSRNVGGPCNTNALSQSHLRTDDLMGMTYVLTGRGEPFGLNRPIAAAAAWGKSNSSSSSSVASLSLVCQTSAAWNSGGSSPSQSVSVSDSVASGSALAGLLCLAGRLTVLENENGELAEAAALAATAEDDEPRAAPPPAAEDAPPPEAPPPLPSSLSSSSAVADAAFRFFVSRFIEALVRVKLVFARSSKCDRSVAPCQSLSSRIRVTRGKRIEIPAAVWFSDFEYSAPDTSQTGASCGSSCHHMRLSNTSPVISL